LWFQCRQQPGDRSGGLEKFGAKSEGVAAVTCVSAGSALCLHISSMFIGGTAAVTAGAGTAGKPIANVGELSSADITRHITLHGENKQAKRAHIS